jgi:hypothetical protein
MDKKTLEISCIPNSGEHSYWAKQSYLKRIAALETLRRIIFGYDPSTERLQRTFTVTQLKKG